MQPNFSSESTDIIIAVIIYLAAFALLMKGVIQKILKSGAREKNVVTEYGNADSREPADKADTDAVKEAEK